MLFGKTTTLRALIGAASLAAASVATVSGCQGQRSSEPPVHPLRNMFNQDRYDHQEPSEFFADKRALRPIPSGAIARGNLKEDSAFYRGIAPVVAAAENKDKAKATGPAAAGTEAPRYTTSIPVEVNADLMAQGQRRYNTYCTPCHGPVGAGGGMVVQKGYPIATSLHEERIRTMPAGEIYNTISNGIRNMPSYGSQIDERDRWAIVAYVRALQRSQHGKLEDVPEAQRGSLGAAPAPAPAAPKAEAKPETKAETKSETKTEPKKGGQP